MCVNGLPAYFAACNQTRSKACGFAIKGSAEGTAAPRRAPVLMILFRSLRRNDVISTKALPASKT